MELLFTLIFLFLFLTSPIVGLIAYIRLIRKMRKEQVALIPRGSIFALFFIYGGVFMEILTGLCWQWSGMSSLGLMFLIFIAPIICTTIAWRQRHNIKLSNYHRIIFRMAVGYLIGIIALFGIGIIAFVIGAICSTPIDLP